jgi:hypothetical protein
MAILMLVHSLCAFRAVDVVAYVFATCIVALLIRIEKDERDDE